MVRGKSIEGVCRVRIEIDNTKQENESSENDFSYKHILHQLGVEFNHLINEEVVVMRKV